MKKVIWIVISVLAFLGVIVYLGNVFIIGDHLGTLLGHSNDGVFIPNMFVVYSWDTIVGLAPFLLLIWVISKNICGYGELNIRALLDCNDEAKLTQVLKGISAQAKSPDAILDKLNLRRNCDYVINTGNRNDKVIFLKQYYDFCQDEAQRRTHTYAVFAAVSVLLSPKSAGDTLALLMWQCRIISTTLKIYGGRPSANMVFRIYAKVLMHSFMAGSIDEVLDQFAFGAMDVKMLSFLTQALAAVATCLRTASLTRYYIYNGKDGDRKEALSDAIKEIPHGIIDVLKSDELKAAWQKFLDCSLEISKAAAEEAGKYAISIITGGKGKTDMPPCPENI